MAPILLAPEYAALLSAAKVYIVSVNEKISNGDGGAIPLPDDVVSSAVVIQSCQVFEFQDLSRKTVVIDTNWSPGYHSLAGFSSYCLTDVCEEHVDDGLAFWARKLPRYNSCRILVKTWWLLQLPKPMWNEYFRAVVSLLLEGETEWLIRWRWGRS